MSVSKASGAQSALGLTSGAETLIIGSQDVGSGRSAISYSNNAGGANNILSFGFGAVTSGVPANPVINLTQAGNVGIGTTAMPADTNLTVLGNYQSGFYRNVSSGGRAYVINIGATSPSGFIDGASITGGVEGGDASGSLLFGTRTSGTVTEKARIDSSGRLLVGTSTAPSGGDYSQYSKLVNIGNTFGSGYAGILTLGVDSISSLSAGDDVGVIVFTNRTGNEYARILCEADATTGSGDYPGRLVFSVTRDGQASPTEAARINNGGYFKATSTGAYWDPVSTFHEVRSAANNNTWFVSNASTSYTSDNQYLRVETAAGTGFSHLLCSSAGTNVCRILGNGNLQNTNNSYGSISDLKLKENIVNATSQWSDIKALQVRKYNFKKETGQQTHTQIGLVAQEVELVSPGLVSESPDRDEDGNDLGTVTKSVNYSVLYMKAVKALQEAIERIETLEAKVAALENA